LRISFFILFISLYIFASEPKPQPYTIEIVGQKEFSLDRLESEMGVKRKSIFEFWKDDIPKIEAKLKPTLHDALESFYESEGFYEAKFSIKETNTSIRVEIKENKPIRVGDVNISSDYNISHLVVFKKGDIFSAREFISIKKNIISSLLNGGYCSYDLDTKAFVDLETKVANLRYILKKGGVCKFGKVNISGLKSIDDVVILSRLRALEGERFDMQKVQDTSNNLYKLNAFDSVVINVDRKFYNKVPVDINFTETKTPYYTELGVGYDTYLGKRVKAEITKNNFLGNAQTLTLKGYWSQKEQLIALEFYKPAFINLYNRYMDLGTSMGYSNLEFDGFNEEKTAIRGYFKYDNGNSILEVGLASEYIIINGVDNLNGATLSQAINEGIFKLFYPYVNFVYDGRDSKLNPKSGYYLKAYWELGLADEDDSSAYLKTQLELRAIETFSDLTLAVVGKIGVIKKEKSNGLPESKYFFGGGSYSNRAYGYRDIGVITSPTTDTIYGASSMLNLSIEGDYPIWGDLYGAVFMDNTMLSEESYDFGGEIISSVGFGVRYMTPIGPFKLDIGFNAHDRSKYGIQFQIGQSF